MRIAVLPVEGGAVPSVLLELKLALGHGQLESLDGGRHDVRVSKAELQLRLGEPWKVFADGRCGSIWTLILPSPLRLHDDGIEEIFLFLLTSLLLVFLYFSLIIWIAIIPSFDWSQRVATQFRRSDGNTVGGCRRHRRTRCWLISGQHQSITTCMAAHEGLEKKFKT